MVRGSILYAEHKGKQQSHQTIDSHKCHKINPQFGITNAGLD